MPGWADFNEGDMFYGFPDLEGRGVKFAHDVHGPLVDPDTQSRGPTDAALAKIVAFRDRRFPRLKNAPMTEARVCQYENSSNGDFLIDFHPRLATCYWSAAAPATVSSTGPKLAGTRPRACLAGSTRNRDSASPPKERPRTGEVH
jgi:glycine/D-amino acid oxidase-like deaminating enzyme